MARFNFGRRGQMWFAVLAFSFLYGLLMALVPGMTRQIWWGAWSLSVISAILCVILFDVWLRRDTARRESSITMLNRVTGGDLSVTGDDIAAAFQSKRMSSAVRALISTLERTIRRFGQLSQDVGRVSEQMAGRSRVLARSANEQARATSTTAASIQQIDTSINAVRSSMEELSANAEETSTSVLEMSASIEEVSRIADTLSEFVDETATAIEQMTASITQVATSTESFSSFATETASSIVEMNATTTEIGRSARESSQLATYVRDAANEGRGAVTGTVDGMRKIQLAVDEAKSALGELGQRSQEIGDIIRVIDEIAGQTNLLALNAAIIAAQAGERGKGFAVVADEIRDLSERTSVSTEEIRTLIGNVQRGVSRASEQMNISATRVGEGVGLTQRAAMVLDKILDLTDRSSNSIQEIAKATEEQTRGSASVTEAIEEVTKMVQQTATATQEQSTTARQIGEKAAMVRDYTRHLKRAMNEQEHGSTAITRAMQNVSGLVQNVLESTSVLASESAAIVSEMDAVQRNSEESGFGVSELNQMATALMHESALLNQEISRFSLPAAREGGSVTTSITLSQHLTLDPIHANAAVLWFIAKSVHARLIDYGEGAELVPELAEKWEVHDHGRRYRFVLRRNVMFHNGRALVAKDVHASLLRLLLPASRATNSWLLRGVRGADEVIQGRSRELPGVVVVDDHTVDIVLEQPNAAFLPLLTMPDCSIIPIEEAGDAASFAMRSIGAGPFRVKEVIDGRHIQLEKHRDYFVKGRPYLDDLRFRLDLSSSRAVADAFVRGELDVAQGIPLNVASDLKNNPRIAPYLLTANQLHTSFLGYDCSSPPFNKLEVRQAVHSAIDRNRINDKIFSGLGDISAGLLPAGLIGYDPSLQPAIFDPDRARRLLRTAGYGDGFEIEYRASDADEFYNSGIVPLIIEDLAAVGIKVRVTKHSVADAKRTITTPGHGLLFCANWYADIPDPDNFFFVFFHSLSTAARGVHYSSPALDAQIEKARASNDLEERASIYRELDRMVVRESPIVPLFHERLLVVHKPHVRAVRTSLVPPPVRFTDVWVEES